MLGFSSITEAQWIELTLPTRMGGLGIRDQHCTAPATYLANVCIIKESVAKLGIPEEILDGQINHALELYHKALRTTPSSAPTIVPQLQQVLTAAIYKRNAADLLDSATPTDLVRISSLASPHAMAWLDALEFCLPCLPMNLGALCDMSWDFRLETKATFAKSAAGRGTAMEPMLLVAFAQAT